MVKEIELPEIGTVKLHKRKGTRSLRISISAQNGVRLTMPTWLAYKAGVDFILDRKEWILKNKPRARSALEPNIRIGKAHNLNFIASAQAARVTTRLVANEARVTYPSHLSVSHVHVQKAAQRVVIKALTKEAETLLPSRLETLARKHGFDYESVSIKRLSSRWGSCSQNKDITLNCFLMQLPWHLIDYVLLHELLHTRIMRHGQPFWSELELYIPNLKEIRKNMRGKQPHFSLETA